jgi:N-acetylmuramoyl-L-alanine amidase
MVLDLPDSPVAASVMPSPNHGERAGGVTPSLLILHYTGMTDAEAARRWLLDPASQVSCHYLVMEDGEVVQLVPEQSRAWHAGRSRWEALTDLNSHSIGVEIVNPGHDWGYQPFPEAQMSGVTALCVDIVRRWSIKPHHVLGHSDVAPMRKSDPGELFDWRRLAEAGAGLWTPPVPVAGGRFLALGDQGPPVEALQGMLALYGYGIDVTGHYDALTEAVVRAFQRHFRPARIDGVADVSTIETLRNLLAMRLESAAPQRVSPARDRPDA